MIKKLWIKFILLTILLFVVIANILFLIIYPIVNNKFNFSNEIEKIIDKNYDEPIINTLFDWDKQYYNEHYSDIKRHETINDPIYKLTNLSDRWIKFGSNTNIYWNEPIEVKHSVLIFDVTSKIPVNYNSISIIDSVIININLSHFDNVQDSIIKTTTLHEVSIEKHSNSLLSGNENSMTSYYRGENIGNNTFIDF